jgi:hypothetical protein
MYPNYTVSPYPNSALPAWQLAVIAIVAVACLAAWLIAVYLAARDTGADKQAAAGSPPESATAESGSRLPSVVGEREPGRPSADRTAA